MSAHPHNPTILDARTCPLCRQGDQVARVATLVRAGTTVSTGVGALALAGRLPGGGALNLAGGSTGAGMGQTALAARLAPPPAPVFDHTNWFRGGIALVVALPIAIGFAAGDGAFGWLMLLCVVAAAVATYRAYRAARVAWRAREARWQREVAVWETTSYCLRDDCVWIPGSLDWTSGDETLWLIRSYVDMDAYRDADTAAD